MTEFQIQHHASTRRIWLISICAFLAAVALPTQPLQGVALYGSHEEVVRQQEAPTYRSFLETRDFDALAEHLESNGYLTRREGQYAVAIHLESTLAYYSLEWVKVLAMAIANGDGRVQIGDLTDMQKRMLCGHVFGHSTNNELLEQLQEAGTGEITFTPLTHFSLNHNGERTSATVLGGLERSPENKSVPFPANSLTNPQRPNPLQWNCTLLELIIGYNPIASHHAYTKLLNEVFQELGEQRDQVLSTLVDPLAQMLENRFSRIGTSLDQFRINQQLPEQMASSLLGSPDFFRMAMTEQSAQPDQRESTIRNGLLEAVVVTFAVRIEFDDKQTAGYGLTGVSIRLPIRD